MLKALPNVCKALFALLLITSNASGQPKITAFSPGSGPVGTSVTITGSGFQATASSNVVYFGAVRAAVTSASAASLTVTAPVGATYQPLSVLNVTTGLTGFSQLPYITTFTSAFGAGIPPNFYKPKIDVPVDNSPNNIAFGDIDGDGKTDMVLCTASSLGILRNITPTGSITRSSFAAEVSFPPSLNSAAVAISDLDGDGKPDIVVTNENSVSVYRNKATAGSITATSLAAPVSFAAGNSPNFISISDLDGDGKADLAVVNSAENTISVLRNTATPGNIGTSSFAPRIAINAGRIYRSIAIADLDGDKKPDITVAGEYLSVLRNISTAGALTASSFAAGFDFAIGTGAQFVSAGDVDGDGKPDLVSTGDFYNSASVLRNTSTAGSINATSFAARVDFAVGTQPSYNALADLNGDGKPDIVTVNKGDNTISVLSNTSTSGSITAASFAANVDFLAGIVSGPLAIADLDADAIPEIAVLSNYDSKVSFFKTSPPPAITVPVISDFSPVSGPVGALITISGFNFNAVPANNTVYFGAVKATVTGGSATRLTVRVPAGATYRPITVLNTATGLTGYATGFTTTFTNPYGDVIPPNFYQPKVDFGAGAVPYALASGDLDGDGKPDLVTVNSNTNTVSILRNVSAAGSITNASFAPKVDLATGLDPRAIAIGDIDGDGKLDIAVTNLRSATVSVYRNVSVPGSIAAASFAARVDFATGANPISVAIGDLNGDGKSDMAVTNLTDGTVSVLRNTATAGSIVPSSFAARINYITSNNTGAKPRSVAIGDLDGDGKPEIVVANEGFNSPGSYGTVTILRNTVPDGGAIGATSFNERLENFTDVGSNCVAIGDLDGDNKPDLAVSNYGSNNITLLRNNFIPGVFDFYSFAYGYPYSTDPQPFFVAIADADGDGRPDLISANAGSSSLTVLRNIIPTGNTGTSDHGFTYEDFEQKKDFPTGGYPVCVAAGDLDGDGTAELATANAGTNSVSVLKIVPPGVPVITGFSPASGPAGTIVTITGVAFNPVAASNAVYFGAVKATVTGGTATSLTVTAPAGATYHPLSVINTSNGLVGYASRPFKLTFNNPFGTGIPANFYRPRTDVPVASAPTYAIAFGDMDGDGKSDMIAVNQFANTVSVLRNTSTGTLTAPSFAGKVDFAVGNDPRIVAVSDIDGDGKLDIVVGNSSAYSFSILRNTSAPGSITTASFAARVSFSTGAYLSSLAVGDLDNDGKPDVVTTNLYTGTISIWHNTATSRSITAATFEPKIDVTSASFPRAVVIRDMNGDGKAEIIAANERSNAVSVFWNLSTFGTILPTSFAYRQEFPVGSNPPSIAAGDVDGDGKPDIVVANYGSNTVSVLRNISTSGEVAAASFAPKVDFATGAAPFYVVMGDADGDGKTDLITANANANTISVLRNTSVTDTITPSSFAPKADFTTSGYPLYLAMGDLDGDGIAEVAAATAATGAISVFKASSPATFASTTAAALQASAQSETTVRLYPNPTSGEFTLDLAQTGVSLTGLEIVNEKGMLIEKRNFQADRKTASGIFRFNLSNQPAGVYYVKVTGTDGVRVIKVVVQR